MTKLITFHDMIAAFIFVLSVAALVHFAVSQWRSIWSSIAAQPLSENLQTATGVAGEAIGADDFELFARKAEQLCPSALERNVWLKEVRVYYRCVCVVAKFSSEKYPSLRRWAKNELVACSRYAGAVLDHRLNANFAYASAVHNK